MTTRSPRAAITTRVALFMLLGVSLCGESASCEALLFPHRILLVLSFHLPDLLKCETIYHGHIQSLRLPFVGILLVLVCSCVWGYKQAPTSEEAESLFIVRCSFVGYRGSLDLKRPQ